MVVLKVNMVLDLAMAVVVGMDTRLLINEYIVVPSLSITTQERVKFASQPYSSLAASCQDVFRPLEASCSVDPFNAAPANDQPLLTWIEHQETFLVEMLHHDGRGDNILSSVCSACGINPSIYHCKDCFTPTLSCQTCIVQTHAHSPMHSVEWNSKSFQSLTLRDLRLRMQLGHKIGKSCLLLNQAFNNNFVLIDMLGIHPMALLCVGWFSAMTTDPRTATTFGVLQQFHILSFESKVSAYEFYHSLVHLTDKTGLLKRKDHYEAFMRMACEYQHVKMLKQAGHGHDPSGILATLQGECAVLCPACPQPGKNLPNGWELIPKGTRWLYACFLTIDTNFRLKRCIVSKDAVDPSLSCGWGYFVDETTYKTHLTNHGMEVQEVQQKSTCASHNAVNMTETKSSQGLAATGLGTIDCAHHNIKLPNGVGDLQKGERYINMDFLFFSVLHHHSLEVLNVSYDIACQWHKNLWARMATFPKDYQLDYAIKMFYLPAHIAKCQAAFSFNWSHWVGHTDGEAPEHGWSNINPVASSTKEMGLGCRHDTLDDHFGDWNWKKVVNLGKFLLCKMKEATLEKAAFHVTFKELNGALTEENHIAWKAKVEMWEDNLNDVHVPNPFEAKTVVIMQAGAHLKLAQLEAQDLERGVCVSLHPEVSPSVFVGLGLNLEEEQKSLSNHITDTQKGNLQCQRNTFHCKVESWRTTQSLYMPVMQGILSTSTSTPPSLLGIQNTEDVKLLLPSAIKWELQLAQAHDALEELCQCLRICLSLLTYKKDWVRGQGGNTRAQSTLEQVSARQAACSARYHVSWGALNALAPELGKLTWIWRMSGVDSGGDGTDEDGVRVEWCKAQAWAMRWAEEVKLLQEEMCCVLQFFQWQATWWDERGHQRVEEDAGCLEDI
ncbi:hypothetical protein BDR05DRAFT_977033 [Suillus weaverae]|nr:hypothetical protein BDR05DRAFT_977033 [Suillus weaverae]